MKYTALALLTLTATTTFANDAILNIEGSLQINGRTIINSDGKWAPEETTISIDCSEDQSALRTRFDQGYRNFEIISGSCYTPRWYPENSATYIKGTDGTSLIPLPNDPYDYYYDEEEDENIFEPSPFIEIGIGGFLYIRDIAIDTTSSAATGNELVYTDMSSNLYFRDVDISTNETSCFSLEASKGYLRDVTLTGCSSSAIHLDNSHLKLRGTTISAGSINIHLNSVLTGYDNNLSNLNLTIGEMSKMVIGDTITNLGTVLCYDSSIGRADNYESDYCSQQ
ncbi:hypothetical protein [Vibrio barjaei]|uniref:hypothetical protein n=1 Tax=Vibrio barjaei TaxID=1676683 RepID=UPI0022833D3E|nr:hypothetical protein [Vibrio barjaei]MCY9873864.1 hypothetical protein [Vibrio barjaei]